MKKILVLGVQVPFVRGGAELLNESLVREINRLDGVQAELVSLPFKGYPDNQVLNDIMTLRLIDIREANGIKVDIVIPTKFPSYVAEHRKKILYLVHQHRLFYDLEKTEFDASVNAPDSRTIRNKVRELDSKFINECKEKYTISKNVSERLIRFNGIESKPLYPPSPIAPEIYCEDYNDTILYIGRIDPIKRVRLLIESLEYTKKAKVTIIGKGIKTYEEELISIAYKKNVIDRCEFLGYVPDSELVHHLANTRALFYAPVDEDYGFAAVEAFLAKKPVITCDDSGEVKTLVSQTGAGIVSSSDPKQIADSIDRVYGMNQAQLEVCVHGGYEFAKSITWGKVLQKLVLENL
ncbi:MAG: glycosyltransferase family 4 protein [Spirochaetota bacterium]|nr:MAG: glycosyltransferase family 4 protein [Spirochaetota bacterium]